MCNSTLRFPKLVDILAYPLTLIILGFNIYSSSDSSARSDPVCTVTPVDVREAAALPVVYLAALYGTAGFEEDDEVLEAEAVGEDFATVDEELAPWLPTLAALALATASFAARILAAEPVFVRLMLLRGSARSVSCSKRH